MTIKANSSKDHRITVAGDCGGALVLVRGGKRNAYLWCGDGAVVFTFSGEKSLRALAAAINKELRK